MIDTAAAPIDVPSDAAAVSRAAQLSAMPLEPWLELGDPLADAVVRRLREREISLVRPLAAIQGLAADGDVACRDFLAEAQAPVDAADLEAMRRGGAMAHRNFPQLLFALVHGGLMTVFCSPDAAYIIAHTGRLQRDVVRRLHESATLFYGVLDAEQLRPGGTAWETCVHVRLMHSMVRLRMLETGAWPRPGQPINALQTAAGQMFFGRMVLDRLQLLGAHMSSEEAAGYLRLWHYVTRLLGVPAPLLGETPEEQAVLDARILPLAFAPDDTSRRLADITLDGLTRMLPVRSPRALHETLTRAMLGDERADAMGIARHPRGAQALRVAVVALRAYGLLQWIGPVARRLEQIGRIATERAIALGLDGRPADYRG